MLLGIDILRRHRDAPIVCFHVLTRRNAVKITTVREAAPGGIDLREVMIATPVARLDQWQDAGSVRARLGSEDPGGGSAMITVSCKISLCVLLDEVQLVRLVTINDQAYGVVQHGHNVRKRVTKEARDANRDIDPGAA